MISNVLSRPSPQKQYLCSQALTGLKTGIWIVEGLQWRSGCCLKKNGETNVNMSIIYTASHTHTHTGRQTDRERHTHKHSLGQDYMFKGYQWSLHLIPTIILWGICDVMRVYDAFYASVLKIRSHTIFIFMYELLDQSEQQRNCTNTRFRCVL